MTVWKARQKASLGWVWSSVSMSVATAMAASSDGGNASIALEVYPTPCGTRNCSMSNFGTYFIPGDPWECNWPDEARIT